MKKYNVIYADPPWTYQDKANAGKRGAVHKYPVMTIEQLCALPVQALAARDCLLAMWWVGPMPREALQVCYAWGFRLKTMKGFTWRKTTKNAAEHFGMGNWTRANTEDCLFAVRGNPKRISAGVRQLISAQVREHSRKPDEIREALVRLMGDVPRIELFARQKHDGWHTWGNTVPNNINLTGEEPMKTTEIICCKCGFVNPPAQFGEADQPDGNGGRVVNQIMRIGLPCGCCGGKEFWINQEGEQAA